jgi:hypothetical protein
MLTQDTQTSLAQRVSGAYALVDSLKRHGVETYFWLSWRGKPAYL